MAYENYSGLKVEQSEGVALITIDHPPINLFDVRLMGAMDALGRELENDDNVRVVVFQSANPDFFIAHADVELILRLPKDVKEKSEELNFFHAMVERYRTMPKVTIGVIEGCARGGGSEFLLSLDMRFGSIGGCVLSQPEVALGILPGGSGTQHLPRLIGRGRALEVILGCEDFDAETAERYGWINRALPPDELRPFVQQLARRIAAFPQEAIALAKRSVDAAEFPIRAGLLEEAWCFQQTLALENSREKMKTFLERGGQTREVELRLGETFAPSSVVDT
ncbi:enoyl-CoA hydratase/isomerase family protein [Myxococcota bacterium]|nr:enoyl-CoA hydratase/isomerase family protein [Myxococcota bacterium]